MLFRSVRGAHPGAVAPPDADRGYRSLRPGQPVLFRRLPTSAVDASIGVQHEQARRLLRASSLPLGYNAAMESWNHSLKVEAIHGERFTTREAAKAQVFEYIEVYYNRKRLHSTLGYLSPEVFEARQAA